MSGGVAEISLLSLSLSFLPVLVVLYILFRWEADARGAFYAVSRMLLQLLLVGYFLGFIFQSNSLLVVAGVLTLMLMMAAWISLRTARASSRMLFFKALFSIFIGGGSVLVLVTQGVLDLNPWYAPNYIIPLAGMIFANSMTAISLVLERYEAEIARDVEEDEARVIAFKAGMIPVVNALLAVGLVSLPGMMTGQILSGIEPHIAARYQIMVMCMIFGSAGISTSLFLMRIPVFRH
ncbi:MAG: ABC transporter permease [Pseudomonadales bacterium]|nr:ABC transporter permease [Pseudomonadales bacterium]